jgi:hypothetical protein
LDQADDRGGDAVLAEPDRDGEEHAAEREVDQRRPDRHRAQERDLPDGLQPVQYLKPQGLAGGCPRRAEPAPDPADRAERDRVGEGIGQERDGPAQAEQQPAERRAREAGGPGPALGEGPCLHELVLWHDRRKRGGGRVEEAARGSLDQADEEDSRPGREVHRDEDAEDGQQDRAGGVAGDHRQPPVEPVRQGPGGQPNADQGDLAGGADHAREYR